MTSEEKLQDEQWESLYRRIGDLLSKYGKENHLGKGDYWRVDDNYGWYRHTIYVFDLRMLNPIIIAELRNLLITLPNWAIVLTVDVVEKEENWPRMGVTIRKHEIIDGLLRDYLPEPYRSLVIPDSRPGTGYD